MKSAIEEILHGGWGSSDFVKPSLDSRKQADRVAELEGKLTELLQDFPEALKAFEAFCEETDTQCMLEVRDFYKAGFRNGVQLMIDAFDGE